MLYFDVKTLLKYSQPFNIVIGGRGTGKTYSALKFAVDEYKATGKRFIYMRRTQTEVDFIAKNEVANPMKSIYDYVSVKRVDKKFYVFMIDDEIIGYIFALSTVASIRGIDMSDVDYWIFDEFIPEYHVHKLAHEGMAFLNAYESFNRNREFNGNEPIKVFLLANSNNFNSDILIEVGLQKKLEDMVRKEQAFSNLNEKRCTLSLLQNIEFEDKKRKTALYQFAKDSNFVDMAINNEFIDNDFSQIESQSLSGKTLFATLGEINIFTGNSKFYATKTPVKQVKYFYPMNDAGIKAFRKDFGGILAKAYIYNRFYFETYDIKRVIVKILTKKEI